MGSLTRIQRIFAVVIMSTCVSACVTKPIKTQSLDEVGGSATAQADFIYYLPKTVVKVAYKSGKPSTVTLTPVTVADPSAGFAVDRPRRRGGRGQVVLQTKGSGNDGKSTDVGLLSHVALTSDAEVYTGSGLTNLTTSVANVPATLSSNEKEKEAGSESPKNASSFVLVQQANEKPIEKEILCGADENGNFVNLSVPTVTATPVNGAPSTGNGCIIVTEKERVEITPVKALGAGWPARSPDVRCDQQDAVCYRQRVSKPFHICLQEVKPATEVLFGNAGGTTCSKGKETIEFVEVFDRTRNYSVALNGQQFVAVTSKMSFENGTLVKFDDKRPGLMTSVAQAPFALGADVLGSVTVLLAAIFVN
ncbi:hypothetical protein [Parvularcula marina]|uniref:hypothetical protein n=1 Tax=Parvularcula marina TaxID=2292771 RepID=UPI0035195A33